MKEKSYFENKNCDICKGQATKFRSIGKGLSFMLCDKKECDLITLYKAGWITAEQLPTEMEIKVLKENSKKI